tara:strand:+ start:1585 stop:1854 length:270 start_codon:yes stop_codon:yes gene_type:complete
MKFLHDRKAVRKTEFDFRTPEGKRAYAKDRYEKMKGINQEKDGLVTKSDYELVMGFVPDKLFLDDKKVGRKWIDKFGQYKGTHDRRQVR